MSSGNARTDAAAVLARLRASPGQLVPHSELLAALGDRALNYREAMHSVRAALGMRRYSKHGPLVSVKGQGYRLETAGP